MAAAMAFSVWLVQMFDDAFSLRMSCSRVRNVSVCDPSGRADRTANEPTGDPTHQCSCRCEHTENRPAKRHRVSQRLALGKRHVASGCPGERNTPSSIGSNDAMARAPRRCQVDRLSGILDDAQIVWLCEDHGGGGWLGIVGPYRVAVEQRVLHDLNALTRPNVCRISGAGFTPRETHTGVPPGLRNSEIHCFDASRRSVVEGCVGHRQAGDGRDHRLVFPQRLKHTPGNLAR